MRKALAGLPWVDPDTIDISPEKVVRLTLKDVKQYDEEKLIDALSTEFQNVKVIRKPKT